MRMCLGLTSKNLMRSLCVLALTSLSAAMAGAATINVQTLPDGGYSGTGNFVHDNDRQLFTFTLSSTSDVNLFTTSWADTNGFLPVLSLFLADADPSNEILLAVDDGATAQDCGPRGIDSTYSFCLDAYVSVPQLSAGDYLLVLTESTNVPNGLISLGSYADGFSRSSDGNFTSKDCFGTASSPFWFTSHGCDTTLNSSWAVSIQSTASATPEPSFAWPAAAILGFFLASPRFRRRTAALMGKN